MTHKAEAGTPSIVLSSGRLGFNISIVQRRAVAFSPTMGVQRREKDLKQDLQRINFCLT